VLCRIVTTLMVWHSILHMGGVWVCLFISFYDDYCSWVACSVFVCAGVGFHRVVDYYCFFSPTVVYLSRHVLVLVFAELCVIRCAQCYGTAADSKNG